MGSGMPTEIQVRDLLPDGKRFVLPPRNLRMMRFIGLAVMAAGIAILVFDISIVQSVARTFAPAADGPAVLGWIPVLIGCLFVPAGLVPLVVGLYLFAGHAEIELRRGQIRQIERVGPFRKSWTRPAEDLRQLVIDRVPVQVNGRQVESRPLANLAMIRAEFEGSKRLLLAAGYPRDWVAAVAKDIADVVESDVDLTDWEPQAIGASTDEAQHADEAQHGDEAQHAKALTLTDAFEHDEAEDVDLDLPQPSTSEVQFEEHPTGITLNVPPAGIWRGSKGLMLFAILWCGFMTLFSGGMFFATAEEEIPWFGYLFVGGFWLVGIGILLAAINMGRRRAVLAVVDESLMVLQSGPFGSKRREWPREQIERVIFGASGMSVNNRPVMELQVHSKDGKKFGMLAGRDDEELRWIAAQLRVALGLTAISQTALE